LSSSSNTNHDIDRKANSRLQNATDFGFETETLIVRPGELMELGWDQYADVAQYATPKDEHQGNINVASSDGPDVTSSTAPSAVGNAKPAGFKKRIQMWFRNSDAGILSKPFVMNMDEVGVTSTIPLRAPHIAKKSKKWGKTEQVLENVADHATDTASHAADAALGMAAEFGFVVDTPAGVKSKAVLGRIDASCHIIEGARVMQLVMAGSKQSNERIKRRDVQGRLNPRHSLSVTLMGLGVSMVDSHRASCSTLGEKQAPSEKLYIRLSNLNFRRDRERVMTEKVQFSIGSFQMDNHAYLSVKKRQLRAAASINAAVGADIKTGRTALEQHAIFPVMVTSTMDGNGKGVTENHRKKSTFLTLRFEKDDNQSDRLSCVFKYCILLIDDLLVRLDSSTLRQLLAFAAKLNNLHRNVSGAALNIDLGDFASSQSTWQVIEHGTFLRALIPRTIKSTAITSILGRKNNVNRRNSHSSLDSDVAGLVALRRKKQKHYYFDRFHVQPVKVFLSYYPVAVDGSNDRKEGIATKQTQAHMGSAWSDGVTAVDPSSSSAADVNVNAVNTGLSTLEFLLNSEVARMDETKVQLNALVLEHPVVRVSIIAGNSSSLISCF
jgi:hypothetical protein